MFLVSMWPNRHVTKLLKEFHKNRKIIFDKYDSQEICEELLKETQMHWNLLLISISPKICIKNLRDLHALDSFPDDSKTKSLREKYV